MRQVGLKSMLLRLIFKERDFLMAAEMCIPETRKVDLFINCVTNLNVNVWIFIVYLTMKGLNMWLLDATRCVTLQRGIFSRGPLMLLSQDATQSNTKSPELILKSRAFCMHSQNLTTSELSYLLKVKWCVESTYTSS